MERKPKWRDGKRFERRMSFELEAAPGTIFPLLCPVREYEWIPDWNCQMIHSQSGVAEKDAVFLTNEGHGMKAVWCCVSYDPPTSIEYLIVRGRGSVVRLSIRLEATEPGSTRLTWTMLFTLSGPLSGPMSRRFSPAAYEAMIDTRKRELELFLAASP